MTTVGNLVEQTADYWAVDWDMNSVGGKAAARAAARAVLSAGQKVVRLVA